MSIRALVATAFAALVLVLPARVRAETPVPDAQRRTPTVIAVEQASPAVVNISTTKLVQVRDPWFRDFFGRYTRLRSRKVQSVGSGVIVHADGYVVTNSHVVRRATEIVVAFDEEGTERNYKGVLLAEDQRSDLALLKIEGDRPFPAVTVGRSDDLMIGEPAIAVGNPFSVGKTVTTGVISAVGRTVNLENGVSFEDFIQTDAAINPGNSGGPLLNIHGEMIGVNTAIIQGGEGIGFAIPADRVKTILARLIEASVDRANLGFRPTSGPTGVTVDRVDEDGPASRGGLQVGDVIERVDDRSVDTVFDFATPILAKNPGDRILVTIRRAGERRRVDLVVPEPPLPPEVKYVAQRLGILGRLPTAEETANGLRGVVVTHIRPDGPAARIQVVPGDVITGLAGYRVADLDSLVELLRRARGGATLEIEVLRRGRVMTGSITVQ